MQFHTISNELRVERLAPPKGKIQMVLDTDTYNEIDDQFAVVHALLSPEQLDVLAIYAAPFFNDRSSGPGDGMEKSFDEIERLLDRLDRTAEGFAYRGSTAFLEENGRFIESDAVHDLIERAMSSNGPLFVVAIGALTNVASAILMEPKIIEKIVVVWLGGHALHWPHTTEFNLAGDVVAARVVLDCGVPLHLLPCGGVTTHLRSTVPEIDQYVKGQGAIGDFLAETFKSYSDDHFGWSKEIWDVVAIAYLINPEWVPSNLVSSPMITQRAAGKVEMDVNTIWQERPLTWSFDSSRHLIRCAYYVQRDPIFQDLFSKLAKWGAAN